MDCSVPRFGSFGWTDARFREPLRRTGPLPANGADQVYIPSAHRSAGFRQRRALEGQMSANGASKTTPGAAPTRTSFIGRCALWRPPRSANPMAERLSSGARFRNSRSAMCKAHAHRIRQPGRHGGPQIEIVCRSDDGLERDEARFRFNLPEGPDPTDVRRVPHRDPPSGNGASLPRRRSARECNSVSASHVWPTTDRRAISHVPPHRIRDR